MKKSLISVLLIIVTLGGFGCEKKTENATTDTTQPPAAPALKAITAQITPPQAAGQPILVTTQPGMQPDIINFSAVFTGAAQTVNITGGPSGPCTLSAANPNCNQNAPAPGTNITVTPVDVAGSNYSMVTNNPPEPLGTPNNTGNDVTKYTDPSGNSVTITITDTGQPVQ